MSIFEKIKASFSLLSIGYIVLGLILLFFPTVSTKLICLVIGAAALITGIIRLVKYFRNNADGVFMRTGFISGFLLCSIGLFFIWKPLLITSILPFIIGLVICFNGLIKLQSAFELRRAYYDKWIISLIIAIVTLVLGLLLIFNPFSGVKLAVMMIGIALIIDGITNLLTARTVKRTVGHDIDYFDID